MSRPHLSSASVSSSFLPSSSSILFENADSTVVVVDLPRSIEEAQTGWKVIDTADGILKTTTGRRRLVSAPAPTEPFATPKGSDAVDHTAGRSLAAQLADLTTLAAVERALSELESYDGPWCLSRCIQGKGQEEKTERTGASIPPGARYLDGTIADCREQFLADAPEFDLVVLDPPWPNRSARRRRRGIQKKRKRGNNALDGGEDTGLTDADNGYDTAYDMDELRAMLEQIPVGAKLARDESIVAVWVTNKPACEALLTDPKSGIFRSWGVELVATWTWLKVTSQGEPVVALDAQWRKPWERLLLARRPSGAGSSSATTSTLPTQRVIVGVPDVHSRKPHLRPLLAPFLPSNREIRGLEVFARNLTADWWAWGNEVLLFQHPSWWMIEDEEKTGDFVKEEPVGVDSKLNVPI